MKESIFAVIIILAVIWGCSGTTAFTTEFCDEMKNSVISCINAAEKNDWNTAKEHAESAKASFQKSSPRLKTFCIHQDINDINSGILKINAAIKLKNRDMCISEGSSLISQLNKISESDHISISNIL